MIIRQIVKFIFMLFNQKSGFFQTLEYLQLYFELNSCFIPIVSGNLQNKTNRNDLKYI